jgi:hypothetical protein
VRRGGLVVRLQQSCVRHRTSKEKDKNQEQSSPPIAATVEYWTEGDGRAWRQCGKVKNVLVK